jgi:gluconolactonase
VVVELADATRRAREILPDPPRAERVAGGFAFTEGPLWTRGALLFSCPNTNTIYRWSPVGTVDVFRAKSGYAGADIGRYVQPGSNGLTLDRQGRLLICQHGERRVVRVEPRGNLAVVADRFEGRRLNSPNDVVVRSDGTVFFTDPPFGLPDGPADPKRELPFAGVFAARDGEVTLVTADLAGPNGLAFSPDERMLYVGIWEPGRSVVMRYALDESGEDSVDGLAVDRDGVVYVCGPGGIWLVTPDGRRLGLIRLPESPHNLAWGDPDASTLYVTAETSVYRIPLRVAGIRPE